MMWRFLLSAFTILILAGCISYTSQHLNTGVLLDPGQRSNIFAVSSEQGYTCKGEYRPNHDGFNTCYADSLYGHYATVTVPHISYIWRLGVRHQWGPFTGVDIGWQLEFPGTLDFDARFGLRHPSEVAWKHSISLGWGIGNWADNSWFAEYAWSYPLRYSMLFYINARETYLATLLADLRPAKGSGRDNFFGHQRRFLHQLSAGIKLGPIDVFLLPDYVHLNGFISYPRLLLDGGLPDRDMMREGYSMVNWRFNLGLEWQQ